METLNRLTSIDSWFLEQFSQIIDMEKELCRTNSKWNSNAVHKAKRYGFSDKAIAKQFQVSEKEIYQFRKKEKIVPAFYKIDTCAGEFESHTPYYYGTYWGSRSVKMPSRKPPIVLIGSGPNRIGQGIEFDYSCVRGIKELKNLGYEVTIINSNPETVSTDYDISDQLFFEPLTLEYIIEVLNFIKPKEVVVQLGGQTPIEISHQLVKMNFSIAGSSSKTIDLAEDRGRFVKVCNKLGFKTPRSGLAINFKQALLIAEDIDYPLLCRPSYVLGGRRMEMIDNNQDLELYFKKHSEFISKERPCLMDQYLESFLEVDVDMVRGVDWSLIGGIIEHIEAAGIHSGDSMGVLPPQRLKKEVCDQIEKLSFQLADELEVLGFLNLQLAIQNDHIYMLEANPRSSRSVPFISKATGIPLVNLGIQAMMRKTKREIDLKNYSWKDTSYVSVKGVVFPFKKIRNTDSILGPEMKSIGEVMGRSKSYSMSLVKAIVSSQLTLPEKGEIFLSLKDKDKPLLLSSIHELVRQGYTLSATGGTARFLKSHGLSCVSVKKVQEGRPHCVDRITSRKVALVFNTTSKSSSIQASFSIRRSCIDYNIPCLTEEHVIRAFIMALKEKGKNDITVRHLLES